MIAQEIHIVKLQRQIDWQGFLESEWKQLDQYNKVGMFDTPRQREKGMTILLWVYVDVYV